VPALHFEFGPFTLETGAAGRKRLSDSSARNAMKV
jgi:hypothetical protein